MELPEGCHCKVDYVQDKHDLDRLDDRIRRRRRNEDYSLRDLEAYINRRVLKAVLEEAGMTVLEGQAEDYYQRLTGEEVSQVVRSEVERHLGEAGIAVDEVRGDFVSYQTVRKHLNECLEICTSETDEPTLEDTRDTISALRMRVRAVVNSSLDRLREHDVIEIGEMEVLVSIKVRCTDCGRTYRLSELFSNRRCRCRAGGDSE